MFSLRKKLLLGSGGLLAVLLMVGGMGIVLISRHSTTVDRIFRENIASVGFGQEMKEALDRLGDLAHAFIWREEAPDRGQVDVAIAQFEASLDRERGNITVPGEEVVVRDLAEAWGRYREIYGRSIGEGLSQGEAQSICRSQVLPLAEEVRVHAQKVITINLQSILAEDGRVKQGAANARRAMYALLVAGFGFAALFVAIMGRSILAPIRALTQSARDIERGNLDLVVAVSSRDELGQLAEAFNSMAARLREFRRTDRARFVRTLRTTQIAINSLPDPVAMFGPDGKVEQANEAAGKLFGLKPGAEAAGLPVKGLADVFRRASLEAQAIQPEGYESAIQVFNGNGQERFFLPHAVPILDEDKQLVGVTMVLADVTHLRRLDEMKSGLLSVVSHELKTPLTSIRMGLHLLLDERVGPLSAKQVELLAAARDDADRLHRLIEGLLEMGRIRSGRVMLDLRPALPEEVVGEGVAALESAFRDKGVKVESDFASDLPPIHADRLRIGLVVSNLLGNALKFTAPGGSVRITVRTGEGEDQDRVVFSVADEGVGIPAESLPHVFERFYRVPGQVEGKGAGLGLAIAREVVEAHGGRIWAESKVGSGSKFSFTIPRSAGA